MSTEAETVSESRVKQKYYIIPAGAPTLALTLLDGDGTPGTKIINQEWEAGRTDQQWVLKRGPHRGIRFKNVAGRLYIGDGTNISPDEFVTGQRVADAIEFFERQTDNGIIAFAFPPSANLVLDNQYQGALPPNPVWLHPVNDTIAQVWVLKTVN